MTGTIDGIDLTPDEPSATGRSRDGDITPAALLEQAKGVLIFRYGVDAPTALSLMQAWASDAGTSVDDVAHALVYAICQGSDVGPNDARLARWLEDRLRHEPAEGTPA